MAGGDSGGWLKVPNLVMESRVKSEIISPPTSGTAMARAMRQILLQVDVLADLVLFLFGILVFLFS